MLKKLSNNETRVVKMFNKNQHKLKARGWATQTELVCQDHNRGFVISLYIIYFKGFDICGTATTSVRHNQT